MGKEVPRKLIAVSRDSDSTAKDRGFGAQDSVDEARMVFRSQANGNSRRLELGIEDDPLCCFLHLVLQCE